MGNQSGCLIRSFAPTKPIHVHEARDGARFPCLRLSRLQALREPERKRAEEADSGRRAAGLRKIVRSDSATQVSSTSDPRIPQPRPTSPQRRRPRQLSQPGPLYLQCEPLWFAPSAWLPRRNPMRTPGARYGCVADHRPLPSQHTHPRVGLLIRCANCGPPQRHRRPLLFRPVQET